LFGFNITYFCNSNLIFNYKNIEMKIAVVGATGMVGGLCYKSISRKKFLSAELILVARRSVGKEIAFNGKSIML
jgi:aspartate-semialdehyde dehydrogenase